jgi:hypothetical protein
MTNTLITLTFVLLVSLIALGRIKEIHHGYMGFIIMVIGIILHNHDLTIFGLVLLADDTYQHVIQFMYKMFELGKLNDFTIIHWIGVWVILTYRKLSPTK